MHFERGNTFGVAGCPVGAKNKLSRAFREALLADFEEHGARPRSALSAPKSPQNTYP